MKIIHTLHSHGYGGAESHVVIQMLGQRQRGHEVLFAGPLDSWLGARCKELGIPAVHLRMTGLYDLPSHWKLHKLIKKWKPDVLHGHLVRASYYVGWANHKGNRPLCICTAHTTNALRHMERCSHIIADSNAIRTNLLSVGYPERGVSVIFTGVPKASEINRESVRAELGLHPSDIVIGHAGRFVRDKGQDVLVKAVSQISDPRVKLLLIGQHDTDFGQSVQALPQNRSRVKYLGYRSDVQRILRALDIYVQPSRREGLPLAISEAFDAGLPVVASAIGGMPEIVHHNKTGLLVEADRPDLLAQALNALLTNSQLAQTLAGNGKRLFDERLNDGVMVDATLKLYQDMMPGSDNRFGTQLCDSGKQ